MARQVKLALTALIVAAATFVGAAPAGAQLARRAPAATVVYTLDDSSHGNPEGVAWDGRFFYVGATGDGTIYRGTLGDPTVHTFIAGASGRAAVGLKVVGGRLYVAGGPTGKIFVFDLSRPSAAPLEFNTGAGGFLNDLVVTARGDVYVTDSFRPTLWRVRAGQLKPGGMVDAISVAPEIPYAAGVFNLNGIVARQDGRELIVIDSDNGALYRIRVARSGHRMITQVRGPALTGGDGMIVDRGKLVVVRGDPASLTFLRLSDDDTRARIRDVRTDATLRGPSTIARARDRYLVVNADFATGTQPFTVSGLTRD